MKRKTRPQPDFYGTGENDSRFCVAAGRFSREQLFALKEKIRRLPGEFREFLAADTESTVLEGEGPLPALPFGPEIQWSELFVRHYFRFRGFPQTELLRWFGSFEKHFARASQDLQFGVSMEQKHVDRSVPAGQQINFAFDLVRTRHAPCGFLWSCGGGGLRFYEARNPRIPANIEQIAQAMPAQAQAQDLHLELNVRQRDPHALAHETYAWALNQRFPQGSYRIAAETRVKGRKGFAALETLIAPGSEILAALCEIHWRKDCNALFSAKLLPKGHQLKVIVQHDDLLRTIKALSRALGLHLRKDPEFEL